MTQFTAAEVTKPRESSTAADPQLAKFLTGEHLITAEIIWILVPLKGGDREQCPYRMCSTIEFSVAALS